MSAAQSTNANLPVRIGRYEVVFTLAAGTPSSLFVARLDEPGTATRPLTIRRISPDVTFGKELDTFFESARPVLGLHHPNVAGVREIISEGGETFVVMDLLEGESAAALLHRLELDSRSLGYGLAAHVVAEAARGLDAAHELGILHEHLTPSDVFIGHDGTVKVLDVGVARAIDRLAGNTSVSERDLPYAAPERCKGDALDRSSDVFSLGALLWELMMGVSPFERSTPADTLRAILREEPKVPSTQVLRNLPIALSEIASRAIARNRADRYPTAAALADDLGAFVKDFPFGGARPTEPLATLMQSLFAKRIKNNARILRRLDSARVPSHPGILELGPEAPPPSISDLERPTVDAFKPIALPKSTVSVEPVPVEPVPIVVLAPAPIAAEPPPAVEPAPAIEAAPVSLDAADLVDAAPRAPSPPPPPAVPVRSSPVEARTPTPRPAPAPFMIRDEALDEAPPARSGRGPLPFVVVAVLLVAVTIGAIVFYTRSSAEPPTKTATPERPLPASTPSASAAAPPPATASVKPAAVVAETTLHIETVPPKATVMLAGAVVGTTPMDLKMPRGTEPVVVELRAQGYQTLRESVVPDVDQRLKLSLVGTAKTPAPNATPYHRFD